MIYDVVVVANNHLKVKGGKDSSMPDNSNSIMSGLSMNISDIDSNYDTMSISSRINMSGVSKMDYGRQKKKWVEGCKVPFFTLKYFN